MGDGGREIQELWELLLSRNPEKVRKAFYSLSETDQKYILEHLTRMVEEPGWHPEQHISAKIALQSIGNTQI